MVVTFIIIGVSSFLFVYWFRCTVMLILRTRTAPEYAQKVAAANRLSFVEVRHKLYTQTAVSGLADSCQSLEQDYQALKYLLGHAAIVDTGSYTAEQRLLMLNFRLLRLWCRAALRLRPGAAKAALLEMSGTLEYFANAMGRRFASLNSQAVRA